MLDRAVTFRDAVPDDAARLSAIGRDTFTETFGSLYKPSDLKSFLDQSFSEEKQLAEILDDTVDIRLASAGGKLLGFCKIGPVKLPFEHDPDTSLELHRLYIRGSTQGVGVGRILLTWAIEQARSRGATKLYLGVWESNHKAIAVYASRGFEAVGDYKFKVGTAIDDEIIMHPRKTSLTIRF